MNLRAWLNSVPLSRNRRLVVAGVAATIALLALIIAFAAGVRVGHADRTVDKVTTTTLFDKVTTTTLFDSVTPPATAAPANGAPPPPSAAAPQDSASALDTLRRLTIDDTRTRAGYSRDLFPTWLDLDGNGCDARDDVLAAESTTPVVRSGCEVVSGTWTSLYDGISTTDPHTLDVDHVVPLANAWRSGAYTWEAPRRAAYANDTTYPDHLIAVTGSSNRSKSDKAPNEWRPPQQASWCRYATAWVTIKATWSLTATTEERDAVGQMLETC